MSTVDDECARESTIQARARNLEVTARWLSRMPWIGHYPYDMGRKPCRVCGVPAAWRYRSVKRQAQRYDGPRCFEHVVAALFADVDETARTIRFYERHMK